MLRRCYIAQKICPGCGSYSAAYGACYMVVAGRYISYYRPQNIEWRLIAQRFLHFHISLYLVDWYMTWAFDYNLNTIFPGLFCKFTERYQLCYLSLIRGVFNASWPHPI